MAGELARLEAWWNDAFVVYRRVVLLASAAPGINAETALELAKVARWEWLDESARLAAADGMRAIQRIALDWRDAT